MEKRACTRRTVLLILAGWTIGGPAVPVAAEESPAVPAAAEAGIESTCLLRGVTLSGGASAGWLYASHHDAGGRSNEALLTNLLITLTTTDPDTPVGFDGAVGETATPSLQGTPEVNREFNIEYAAVLLRPYPGVELTSGLLLPVSGFEDTYTYNNANIVHGLVSSQQPYNAYGAALQCTARGYEGHLGYYSERLAKEEYAVEEHLAGRSWEVDLGGQTKGTSYRVYHYHLKGMRYLTGAVVERTIARVYLALNADWCRWDESMADHCGRRHALGAALYVTPEWGRFSLPARLEYVDQGRSRFYLDNPATKTLSSATVTPTWQWTESNFLRAEASYARAHDGFADGQGQPKSDRVYLAAEVGCLF